MDFGKIEYFLKAAEKLNFTDAAKELYITPQALTQQIAQLEKELGIRLFCRSTRRVTLTEAGLFCYQKFAPVKTAYEQAQAEVSAKLSLLSNTLRAGFFHGLPKNKIVTPWLNLLQSHFPALNLEIISTDLGSIWRYLDDGKLDICLTNVDSYFSLKQYRVCTLVTAPAQIIISLNHPWAIKECITPTDMEKEDMLQLEHAYESQAPNFYSTVKCRSIHTVNDFDTMLASLDNGKYFAVFPPIFEFQEQARFKYFPLPKEYQFSFSTVCAAKKKPENERVSALFDFLDHNY